MSRRAAAPVSSKAPLKPVVLTAAGSSIGHRARMPCHSGYAVNRWHGFPESQKKPMKVSAAPPPTEYNDFASPPLNGIDSIVLAVAPAFHTRTLSPNCPT